MSMGALMTPFDQQLCIDSIGLAAMPIGSSGKPEPQDYLTNYKRLRIMDINPV